jgi:radical SAM protein with 4Fe4S-binding SPASM domain
MHLNELTVEINQKCPNRCLFCSSLASCYSETKIPKEKIIDVAEQAIDLGLKRICISGGEPLCHPEIVDIICELNELGLKIALYTTGQQIENNTSIPFMDWRKFEGIPIEIIFNVQSTNPEIHDKLVGREGAFRKTKESIFAALKCGFNVEAHVVPNKINIDSLESTVQDLICLGVKRVSFLRIVYQGYARQNKEILLMNDNDHRKLREFTNEKIRFGIPFSGIMEKPQICNAGMSKLIIRYDGKVLPCEAFKDCLKSEFILGDIYNLILKDILLESVSHSKLTSLRDLICAGEPCPAQLLYVEI